MAGMATLAVTGLGFDEGASVKLYAANSQNPNGVSNPSGTAVATATVTANVLTFTGITANVPYVAYASGRSVPVRSSAFVAATKWRDRVLARRVAMGTTLPGYTG